MSTGKINITQTIAVQLSHVYQSIATKTGWFEWFAHKGNGAVGKGKVLQTYQESGETTVLLFTQFVPDQLVKFTQIDTETLATSQVEISLELVDGVIVVTLSHTGLEESEVESQRKLWEKKLENMKSLLETGKDLRLWNRPFLGVMVDEWVTPEIAAERQLHTEYGMLLSSVFDGKGAQQAGLTKGDTIISLAGKPVKGFSELLEIFETVKAGEAVPVQYVRDDELNATVVTLSPYPVPEVPANAQDLAERLEDFFRKVNSNLDQLLSTQTEPQTLYRPGAGEWNANEILAHLIASNVDIIEWMGTYIAGSDLFPYTSGTPSRIKAILAIYPTMGDLLEAFHRTQKEMIAMVTELPAEIISRKASLARLAMHVSMDISKHIKDHLKQLDATLEKAVEARVS